jgi:hypothetical protein
MVFAGVGGSGYIDEMSGRDENFNLHRKRNFRILQKLPKFKYIKIVEKRRKI